MWEGRVLNYWLYRYPRNKIYGVEIDPEISVQTSKRLEKYKQCTVLSGSILDKFPADGTIFYLYNPFDKEILREFSSKIKKAALDGRGRTIVYVHCKHLHAFDDEEFKIRRISGLLHETCIITTEK